MPLDTSKLPLHAEHASVSVCVGKAVCVCVCEGKAVCVYVCGQECVCVY